MGLKKSFISLMLAVVLSLGLATVAMAVPGMPHAFHGSVSFDGAPVPNGMNVSARIDGVEYVDTTTLDGTYGYSPTFKVPADDPDTPEVEGGVEGDSIKFYIEELQVATYTFSNGEVTILDLAAETPDGEVPEAAVNLKVEVLPPPGGGGGSVPVLPADTVNWPVIGGIIAAAVIVIGLIVFFLRRIVTETAQ